MKKKLYLGYLCCAIAMLFAGCSDADAMQETMKQIGNTTIEKPNDNTEIEIPDPDVPKTDTPIPDESPEIVIPNCDHNWQEQYEVILKTPAWDEQKLIKKAWTEQKLIKNAWTENKLIKAAWDETIVIQEAYDEIKWIPEQTIIEEYGLCGCGYKAYTENDIQKHTIYMLMNPKTKHSSWNCKQTIKTIPAHTETIHHDTQYQTIHHDAQYETIRHPAEYQTIEHPATYQTIHHEPVYEKRLINTICTKCYEIKN